MAADAQKNIDTEDAEHRVAALLKRIQDQGSLPALEANVANLSILCRKSSTRAADLAAVIMRDSALASTLLATINSALYRPRIAVQTVSTAVVLLGFEKVQSLALRISLFDQQRKNTKNRTLYRLLLHSYFTGLFAMALSRIAGFRNPEEAFVAGLLNQLPHQVLANAFPDDYGKMEQMIKSGVATNYACMKTFGVDYDELCQAIINTWNLPDTIARTILKIGGIRNPLYPYLREAIAISDIIFHQHRSHNDTLLLVQKRIQELLKNKKFSVFAFIKAACTGDKHISQFFHLSDEDIARMVNVLKDGCYNAGSFVNLDNFTDIGKDDAAEAEERSEKLQKFVDDINQCVQQVDDILEHEGTLNQALMIAQEAVYSLVKPTHLITARINTARHTIDGVSYVGDAAKLQPAQFSISLTKDRSPVIKCIVERRTQLCDAFSTDLLISAHLLLKLKLSSVLITPIIIRGNTLGLFFAGRSGSPGFTRDDQVAAETIVQNLAAKIPDTENEQDS